MFIGVYSRNTLFKIKDGRYVVNLDEYKSVRTHWIDLYVNGDNGSASHIARNFYSFGVKHIPKHIPSHILSLITKIIKKVRNLKLVIILKP